MADSQILPVGSSEILIRKYQFFFEIICSFRFLTNPTVLSFFIQKTPENEVPLAFLFFLMVAFPCR